MKNLKALLTSFKALILIALTSGLSVVRYAYHKVPRLNWHIDVTTLKTNLVNYNNPTGNGSAKPRAHFTLSRRLSLKGLAINTFITALLGSVVAYVIGIGAGIAVAAAIFTLGTVVPFFYPWMRKVNISLRVIAMFATLNTGMAYAGVAQEVWVDVITPHLYPENDWVYESMDDSQYLNGTTVHLPQIGAAPNVVVNRTTFPATPSQRIDTIKTYTIAEFSTDPTHITYTEEDIISYDKLASVIQDHIDVLSTDSLNYIMNTWCPAAPTAGVNLRVTTGASRPAGVATQTGSRDAATLADVTAVDMYMTQQLILKKGRVSAFDPVLYNDLLQLSQFTNMLYVGQTQAMVDALVERALGFKIYVNPLSPTYSSANALNAFGAAPQASDNQCAVFWHPRFVRRAWGNLSNGGIKVWENPDRAEYYGGIFSAMVRAGGSLVRADGRGVCVLVEG